MNFLSLFKRKIIYILKKKKNLDKDKFKSNNFDELFFFYNSDKSNIFKLTKKSGHGYSRFYEKHLKAFKNKKIKILEIGSYAGGSAAAFKKYFKKSQIFCFDINIANFEYISKDIQVFGLDVSNLNSQQKTLQKIFIKEKFKYFDLIIDDGSHQLKDILTSFRSLFSYLKKGGFYIIEDYMLPNFYDYNRDIKDVLVDRMISSLKKKKLFRSNIIDKKYQIFLHKNIQKISTHKGKLKDSHICFVKKID